MFVGLVALVVAAIGLIRQRVAWTRVIATRRDAGFLLLASLVLLVVGALLDPTPKKVQVSSTAAAIPAPASPEAVTATPPPLPTQSPASVAPAIPSPRVTPIPEPTFSPAPAYTAPAPAYSPKPHASRPKSTEQTTGAYNGGGTTDTYTNVDGNEVERPDSSSSGASAKCKDGTYSHSQHRSGTCSGHGGVAQRLSP